MPYVTGTVLNDANEPAQNFVVRAYLRETGALIGVDYTSDGQYCDPLYANVALLLRMRLQDTVSGDPFGFVDSGPANRTVTRNGNLRIFGNVSGIYGSAGYFDRVGGTNGSFLSIPGAAQLSGAQDFCVEAWINVPSFSTSTPQILYSQYASGTAFMNFEVNPSGRIACWLGNSSGGGVYLDGTTPLPLNQWVHVAVSRQSGTCRLFQNGQLLATSSSNVNIANTGNGRIGREANALTTWDFLGYINDFRITLGHARYTSTFTPSFKPAPTFTAPRTVGTYRIDFPQNAEVQVVCLDDAAGTVYNDKIARGTPAT